MIDKMNTVYKHAKDVVAREIEDEIVIVPIISGIGSMDDDLYTLNSTGKQVWKLINGEKSLIDIARILENEYEASLEQICDEINELVSTLSKKGLIIEA